MRWLMPIILAIWETKIGRIVIPGQSGQTDHETPSPKNNQIKMDWRHSSSDRVPAL
jgi:hypothetical protein